MTKLAIIESNAGPQIDPPRTRTWNLRLRRPTPYPLGQRALNASIGLHHTLQEMESSNARHGVTAANCTRALSDWSDAADNSNVTHCVCQTRMSVPGNAIVVDLARKWHEHPTEGHDLA